MQHSPVSKIAVCCPVGDPTNEQGVCVVACTGRKVVGTVGKRNVDPRHSVVHRGEHGKRLIWKEFQETCHSS